MELSRDDFVRWGKKGGEQTKKRHGVKHFSKISSSRKLKVVSESKENKINIKHEGDIKKTKDESEEIN